MQNPARLEVTRFPVVVSGTAEGTEGFTTAAGSEKTGGGSAGPGTTLGDSAGMEIEGGKHLLPDGREAAGGF